MIADFLLCWCPCGGCHARNVSAQPVGKNGQKTGESVREREGVCVRARERESKLARERERESASASKEL